VFIFDLRIDALPRGGITVGVRALSFLAELHGCPRSSIFVRIVVILPPVASQIVHPSEVLIDGELGRTNRDAFLSTFFLAVEDISDGGHRHGDLKRITGPVLGADGHRRLTKANMSRFRNLLHCAR
jgi:hypothetical protein